MFSEELSYQGPVVGLGQESGRLARGAGPSYYQTNVIAGSSGGFGSGLTLLEAVINGTRFGPDYPRVELQIESKVVDLGAKSARNCALPCYFVACFGAGRLTLLDPSGNPVFETAADGWVRIPLYRAPATVLPAGMYSVRATGIGSTVSIPLQIK